MEGLVPDIPPGHRILLSKFVQDIRKQSNAFTGKPRPVKVSANKLSKAKGSHDSASSTRNAVSPAISQEGIEDLADANSRVSKQEKLSFMIHSNYHLIWIHRQ